MTNMSKRLIDLPKHVTVAWVKGQPNTIVITDTSLIDSEENNSDETTGRDLNHE